jgi:hypothetical protein
MLSEWRYPMIDTVAIRHAYRNKSNPPPLGFFLTRRNGDTVTHCRNPPKGSHLPRLTWTHQERTGGSWLSSEVSLPKFYFGDNVQMLNPEQLQTALSDVQEFVEAAAELPFDVPSATVGRVDFGYNIRLEDENAVKAYLRAANRASLPRYKRVSIDDSTVTMKSPSREICIYSKFDETSRQKDVSAALLEMSVGIVRIEPRIKKRDACTRLAASYGFENNVQSLLTPVIAKGQIEAAIQRLGIDKPIRTAKSMLDLLVKNFGNQAFKYYAFLKTREELGDGFWTSGVISRATYFRMVSELKKAGCLLVAENANLSAIRVRDSDFKSTVE